MKRVKSGDQELKDEDPRKDQLISVLAKAVRQANQGGDPTDDNSKACMTFSQDWQRF